MSRNVTLDLPELVQAAQAAIDDADDTLKLEQLRLRYLGRKGVITAQLKQVGILPAAQRPGFGQAVNAAKTAIQEALVQRDAVLASGRLTTALDRDRIDVTLPGRRQGHSGVHPITRTIDRMQEIFGAIGFDVAEGPQMEDNFHNFEALNIPADHPARAMHDTFYIDADTVLRTHTSPVQIRYMLAHRPPLQVIAPGPAYRCDSDMTHTPMFHQLEGLAVDTGVSFADLKGVLTYSLRAYFENDLEVRFRPSFFPFTEPSAEVDISCVFCAGHGCRVCKRTGWLEVLGCGMVHPEVFRHAGVDSERYSGYAFGIGIERLTALHYGIDDIRLLFENDLHMLNQFH